MKNFSVKKRKGDCGRRDRQRGAYNIDHILCHNSRSLGLEVKKVTFRTTIAYVHKT